MASHCQKNHGHQGVMFTQCDNDVDDNDDELSHLVEVYEHGGALTQAVRADRDHDVLRIKSHRSYSIVSMATQNESLVIGHWSLVIGHWSLLIGHW
jgi:hypothetical protein